MNPILTSILQWSHYVTSVCEDIVCQSAKQCYKFIDRTHSFQRISVLEVCDRLHEIQLVKAYYIFVL